MLLASTLDKDCGKHPKFRQGNMRYPSMIAELTLKVYWMVVFSFGKTVIRLL